MDNVNLYREGGMALAEIMSGEVDVAKDRLDAIPDLQLHLIEEAAYLLYLECWHARLGRMPPNPRHERGDSLPI